MFNLSEMFLDVVDGYGFKSGNDRIAETYDTVFTVCFCVPLRLGPDTFNGVQLTVEFGQHVHYVALFLRYEALN